MPETNDYLAQLLARVDKKLNDGTGESAPAQEPETSEPEAPKVFTSAGRFEGVPSAEQHDEEPAAAPKEERPDPFFSPDAAAQEVDDNDKEAPADDHQETVQKNSEKTDKKTFSFTPVGKPADLPKDEPGDETEDVLDWDVSEDAEKYLTSGDGHTIFDKMADNVGKKSRRAARAERRMLKENTRELMDRNSGARRGCFGTFFHIIFLLLLIALTVLAVLYVLQTIAGITIIDINSILNSVTDAISKLFNK